MSDENLTQLEARVAALEARDQGEPRLTRGDAAGQTERRLRDAEWRPDAELPLMHGEPDAGPNNIVDSAEALPLAFAFAGWVKDGSGNITDVKIHAYPYTACVVCHHARLMDDGTLHSSDVPHNMGGSDPATVALVAGVNEIYCKISNFAMGGSGGDDVPSFDISIVNNPTSLTDGDSYYLLAKIALTDGAATVFEWAHTGCIHVFTWDIGTYVMSATLNGDLVSGYTLATTTRKLMLGPCFASGAIT